MSDSDVLAMPIFRFWSAIKNVDRIEADRNIGLLRITNAASSSDVAKKTLQELESIRGQTFVDKSLSMDPDAYDKLGALISGR